MYCESGVCRFSEGFDDNCSRLCFIRRVLSLLVMAMLMMFGQILLVAIDSNIKSFLAKYYWFAFIGVTAFISVCMLLSCSNVARSCFPWNFILFMMLIETLTVILAVAAALFSPEIILLSIICQAAICLMLLILALTVPVDFSKWTILFLVLFLIVFVFAIATIISLFTIKLKMMLIFYSLVVVTILSLMMILNLQVLFNGAIFELYPDDFILGAILMFADVIIFFMCCLKLIGFDTDEC